VSLYGLGHFDRGLVGDLGLVKLLAARTGRWVEAEETRALLEPYGEWAGLASLCLIGASPRRLATAA
jgi:3-methyladenine DNA glycosylase/8-oxoguanine DNA glycosylase